MDKLTAKEEDIMMVLWELERAFVKDIVSKLSGKNHYNTISTIVRNLEDKGYVAHQAFGKTHQYFPVITKEQYSKTFLATAMDGYFENSYKDLVSFFAKEEKITAKELREILNLIENK